MSEKARKRVIGGDPHLKRSILCILILPSIVLVSCATDTEISSSVLPERTKSAISTIKAMPIPTSTGLLTINEPATTPTETFASAMIATHPHSEELLYGPFGAPLEYQFVETSVGTEMDWRSDYITNTNKTFRAFTACNRTLCHERIFIENLNTNRTFEFLFSQRLNWRPILHTRWLDNDILLFDQWSQPRYGFEFAIAVREQELLLTLHVTDKCFVYGIYE